VPELGRRLEFGHPFARRTAPQLRAGKATVYPALEWESSNVALACIGSPDPGRWQTWPGRQRLTEFAEECWGS